MTKVVRIEGGTVLLRRSICGWVAVLGDDYSVRFQQPTKRGVWTIRRPYALEPLATASSLKDAVAKAIVHYEILRDHAGHSGVQSGMNHVTRCEAGAL